MCGCPQVFEKEMKDKREDRKRLASVKERNKQLRDHPFTESDLKSAKRKLRDVVCPLTPP